MNISVLFVTCISSLVIDLLESLTHFKIGLLVLLLGCKSSLYILDINPLSYMLYKYFLLACGLPFNFF